MSNRSRNRPHGSPSQPRRGAPRWLWPAAAGLVVLVAVVAVVAGGGDTTPKVPAGVEQTRPVTVTGTALPVFVDGGDTAVGTIAPELRGASFDGTRVEVLHDGRPKVLVFAAHWCPHCQREIPVLVQHFADDPLPKDLDVVLVATGTTADRPNFPPSAWLTKEAWPTTIMADDDQSSAGAAFGLSAFPYFVALDSSGKVAARTSGELTTDQFDQLVAAATASSN